MLDQLIDGLRSFGVLDSVKENTKILEPVFVVSTAFSANAETLMDCINGDFSESGSNNKEIEVNIFKFFSDYIEDLECEDSGEFLLFFFLIHHS